MNIGMSCGLQQVYHLEYVISALSDVGIVNHQTVYGIEVIASIRCVKSPVCGVWLRFTDAADVTGIESSVRVPGDQFLDQWLGTEFFIRRTVSDVQDRRILLVGKAGIVRFVTKQIKQGKNPFLRLDCVVC